MGFLDSLFNKEKAQERQIEKLRKKLTNMWVQSGERNYAAEQLRDLGTDAALLTLMERFKHNAQNTTYDNEEKIYVYDLLVSLGPQIEDVVKTFLKNEPEQTNWPMKVLDDLLTKEEMGDFIRELLASMDVDYERNPERKEQLILRSREYPDNEELMKEVSRFTMDDHETIRFQAVNVVIDNMDKDWALDALRNNLKVEDSGRVLTIVCNQLAENPEYSVYEDPEDQAVRVFIDEHLPRAFFLTEEGFLRRK